MMLKVRAFFIGLLLAMAFPPLGWWPLGFLSIGLFYFTLFNEKAHFQANWKESALFWGSVSFFINILGFYWIAYLIHEFGGLNWILASILMLVGFVLLAFFSLAWGAIFSAAMRKSPARYHPWVILVALLLWDAVDFRFFPWTAVMFVGSNRALMAAVGLWGTWGWRFLIFPFCFLLVWFWMERKSIEAFSLKAGAAVLIFLAIAFGGGYWNLHRLQKEFSARQPVALLQGNVGNYEKKLTKLGILPTVMNVMHIHQDLIEKAAIHFAEQSAPADGPEPWVAWPETSFPGFPLSEPAMGDRLFEWVKLTRGLHLVGAYESAPTLFAGETHNLEFNTIFLVHESKGILDHYRKRIRIPFGEYIPGDEYYPQLYTLLPAINHFGSGDRFQALPHPDPQGPVFIPVVCYEILFNGFVREFVASAHKEYPGRDLILVNPSNDSWYGPTSEPWQNSFLARWQAASLELPMLRATNTGLSQIVAPWGEVMATGPRDEAWLITGGLPVRKIQRRLP